MHRVLSAFGAWPLRLGALALFVTALIQALLPELGYLVFKSLPSGTYTSNEFRWELAWLPYGVSVACLVAGAFLVSTYGNDRE